MIVSRKPAAIRSRPLRTVCFVIACWAATSFDPAHGSEQNGLQRFVTAHAATMARYCGDAVATGELVTLAFAKGYATAIKVGAKVVSWLSCREALPAVTRWAVGEQSVAEPVIQVDQGQLDFLAGIAEPEQLTVEIGRIPLSQPEGERINALPRSSVRTVGSYGSLMRRIDPNWVPPPSQAPPSQVPLPPGAWRVDIIPER